jgi:RNA polymerase sigma-70 factor (ECF subfamily)
LASENKVANTNFDDIEIIIQGCIRKSERHQEMLYKKYFGYALSVATLYSSQRNDAIEIVDDSFLKVFSEIERLDTKQSFKGWLRKIVINTSIDKFRKKAREMPLIEREAFPDIHDNHGTSSGQPEIISRLTAQEIITMLNELPEAHKTVFCLYEIEGYSHDEIAGQLNMSISTSRVYLMRAKKKLRELYQVYYNTNHK